MCLLPDESKGDIPYKPVDAFLTLEISIGVLSVYLECNGFYSRLLAVKIVKRLNGKAFFGSPSRIHSVKHTHPVAGFGSALSGVQGDNGVVAVILAVKKGCDPELFIALLEFLRFRLYLVKKALVLFFLSISMSV